MEWWRPAVTTLVTTVTVGLTIWLIQLNAVELLQEQRLSQLEAVSQEQTKLLNQNALTLERTSNLISRLETRMQQAEKHVDDAEDWKRRIMLNEHRLNGK